MRDDATAAAGVGVDIGRVRLLVYLVAAAGAGAIGVILFLQKLRISPEAAFSVLDWTAFVLFMVIIGGIGTIEGPLVGIVDFLRFARTACGFRWVVPYLLGVVAVVTMITAPRGVWGWAVARWGFRLLPIQRRLPNPGSAPDMQHSKRLG